VAAVNRRRTRTTRYVPPSQEVPLQKNHQVEPDKCMWTKKYKGYRFKTICNELEVTFKPCHKFTTKLGGYASKGKESDDD
jgi:hypothetical protein